ncbi:unnamed protein product [Polarella glacialis]|uniref:RNase H type-1 domain-containing protein n=1 Tax=Polarella glacialis TaxID=89957 RepID=A0A813GAK5_POLGL|nr:unnamed protein product [Polarella glacialis]
MVTQEDLEGNAAADALATAGADLRPAGPNELARARHQLEIAGAVQRMMLDILAARTIAINDANAASNNLSGDLGGRDVGDDSNRSDSNSSDSNSSDSRNSDSKSNSTLHQASEVEEVIEVIVVSDDESSHLHSASSDVGSRQETSSIYFCTARFAQGGVLSARLPAHSLLYPNSVFQPAGRGAPAAPD